MAESLTSDEWPSFVADCPQKPSWPPKLVAVPKNLWENTNNDDRKTEAENNFRKPRAWFCWVEISADSVHERLDAFQIFIYFLRGQKKKL